MSLEFHSTVPAVTLFTIRQSPTTYIFPFFGPDFSGDDFPFLLLRADVWRADRRVREPLRGEM
jgi:hypothetical protein